MIGWHFALAGFPMKRWVGSGFFMSPGWVAFILKRLWQEEAGQDLVEYALLLVLVSLACITAMKGLASSISAVFASAATSLTSSS
jgi:pilus assembly protein Flp/PilA